MASPRRLSRRTSETPTPHNLQRSPSRFRDVHPQATAAIQRDEPEAARLREEVERYHEWVAGHDATGCLPPRFKRVFTGSWLLGSRWYAVGSEGNYQRMSETERLAITVAGDPVAEVDMRASHLSIMHGLLGVCRSPTVIRMSSLASSARWSKPGSLRRWGKNPARAGAVMTCWEP